MIHNPIVRKQTHIMVACTVAPVLAAAIQQAAGKLVTDGVFTSPNEAAQELINATASLLLLSDATPDRGEPANINWQRLRRKSWCMAWFNWRFNNAERKLLSWLKSSLADWQAIMPQTDFTRETVQELQDEIAAVEAGLSGAGVGV